MNAMEELRKTIKKSAFRVIMDSMESLEMDAITVEAFIDGFLYAVPYEELQRTTSMDIADAFGNTYIDFGPCGHHSE